MNTEINHHGILGMKWGQKNGPPYPLGSSDHSASEKKAGWRKSLDGGGSSSISKRLANHIRRKKAKKAVDDEVERKRKEPETEEDHESRKKSAISAGNASEILKYAKELSTQELQDARNRVNTINDLKKASASEHVSTGQRIKTRVQNLTDAINTGMNLYDSLSRADKAFRKDKETITEGQRVAQKVLDDWDSMTDEDKKAAKSDMQDRMYFERISKGQKNK